MKYEPFIFARSLNGLSDQLRESVPLFNQLQRSFDRDRPAPKFNGFENQIGWEWKALVHAYNALRDLHYSSSFAAREYAIEALNGFWRFTRQIGLKFECVDPELRNMYGIEREYVDEDVTMGEDGSIADSQPVWGSSVQAQQGFMPPAHSNFAITSAGDTAKPAPPPYHVEPVRPTSEDSADINMSSDSKSSMDLDAGSQPPPPLPLPSALSSAQAAEPSQSGNVLSQFHSRLASILSNTGLGQQAQAAVRQAPAQDASLTPIQEEEEEEYEPPDFEEESEEEYEPPDFEEESEEEYEPPGNFNEVGKPSVAGDQEQSASANNVEARNASGHQNDDVEDPKQFEDCNGIRVRRVDLLQNLIHVEHAFSLPGFQKGLVDEIATVRKTVREQLCGKGELAMEDTVLTRLASSYIVSSVSRAIVTAEELQGTQIIRDFQSEVRPLTTILGKVMAEARQHNSPLADNEAFRKLNDDLKQMDEILGDVTT